jgi:hypothetical protein
LRKSLVGGARKYASVIAVVIAVIAVSTVG